jgi:hypothetical protein
MASKRIESLSQNDLDYMDHLLSKEFTKCCANRSLLQNTVSQFNKINADIQIISRLRDAIYHEKKYRATTSAKW